MDSDGLLSIAAAARALGLSRETLHQWAKTGRARTVRDAPGWRFLSEEEAARLRRERHNRLPRTVPPSFPKEVERRTKRACASGRALAGTGRRRMANRAECFHPVRCIVARRGHHQRMTHEGGPNELA